MDQEKMDCMHRGVHGPGQILPRPFCAGEELCLLQVSEVPQALQMGKVIGLGHSPERLSLQNGWHKRTYEQIPSSTRRSASICDSSKDVIVDAVVLLLQASGCCVTATAPLSP